MSAAWIQPEWTAPSGVRALCTLREGGVSAPPFDSLNLGAHVGDEAAAVESTAGRPWLSARGFAEPAPTTGASALGHRAGGGEALEAPNNGPRPESRHGRDL